MPSGRPGDDHRAPLAQRLEAVLPGRRADRLHHRVDALRQPRPRLEGLVRAEVERPGPLRLVPAGHPHPDTGGPAEGDQRGGDSAARALDEDRRARLDPRLGEEHAVRREPCRRQAGGLLEGQPDRFGHQVAPRHEDQVGERPVVPLGQQGPFGVERLVAPVVGIADDGVHDHLGAVLVDAGTVAPEHHRQPVLGQAHTPQAPDVVVVERRRAQPHGRPALSRRGIRVLPDAEPGQRIVRVEPYGGGGEHAPTLPTAPSAGASPRGCAGAMHRPPPSRRCLG